MDKRLIDLVAAPTAITASAVGRYRQAPPTNGRRRVAGLADKARASAPEWVARPDLARRVVPVVVDRLPVVLDRLPVVLDSLPVVLDRLPSDELARRLRLRRPRSRLASLLPGRSRASRREQTIRLARNLGAAASATILAVELAAELRRAFDGDGQSAESHHPDEAERRQPDDRTGKSTRAEKVASSR